jgi:hypothetical protein
MNCKPGDLAIVIGTSRWAGRLVEVLYAAPSENFELPDGHWHRGREPGYWVVHSLGSPVETPVDHGATFRMTMYFCADDSKLRPLPGESEVNEEHESACV